MGALLSSLSRILSLIALAVVLCPAGAFAQAPAARTDASLQGAIACTALEQQDFTGVPDAPTTLISARVTPAANGQDEYCAVVGVVQPQVQFELRLPTRTWNGRYFQAGCGGLCGYIDMASCAGAQARGFAVAAQNMGHVGHVWRDQLWAADPMLRADFGPRSTHVVALAAKAIIERFYGARAAYSYFQGCSTGGREGLSEAQAFPADFDGIIAGHPAFPGRQGSISNNWAARQLLDAQERPVFSPAKLQLLANAVMQACDGLDGQRDGIIDDPRRCHFDPGAIACAGAEQDNCLNATQVSAARELYRGPRNSRGQALSTGGQAYGSETQWDGYRQRAITIAALRYLAFESPRPDYNYRTFNFDTDIASIEGGAALFDPVAPRATPDLTAFQRRGGKLLIYHGWSDPAVSPSVSLDFYANIAARQGGLNSVRNWFRVFMVPGMFHCGGGAAPNTFDFLPHMMSWVEGGAAPDGVEATQRDANGQVVRTRPLYAYPNVARYDGSGDINDAANWRRSAPPQRFNDISDWLWAPARR